MTLAVMFPGQGAQFRGMGLDVFGRYPGLVQYACDLLGYDLVALCRDNPDDVLSRTEYTQPALYTVNALHMFERERREPRPADYYLGHSLGEYNALLAAGAFDFETGLDLVRKRGELMAGAIGGGMTAVMKTPAEQLMDVLSEDGVDGVDVAAFNTDTQLVIAGPSDVLRDAHASLRRRNIRFAPLRVGGAFHSRYMAGVRAEFEDYLRDSDLSDPVTPVIANVTGRPHRSGSIVTALGEQLVAPVQWTAGVRYLLDRDPRSAFEEVGGKDLTRMVDTLRTTDSPMSASSART